METCVDVVYTSGKEKAKRSINQDLRMALLREFTLCNGERSEVGRSIILKNAHGQQRHAQSS